MVSNMKHLRTIASFAIFLLIILVAGTLSCTENKEALQEYVYEVPVQTGDGWETASLSDVGMEEIPIIQYMNDLLNNLEHKVHGILIIKDGKLVLEEYFPGIAFYHGPLTAFDRNVKHNMASVTKSFTAALLGLAIDHGFVQDVDQKVFSFFPEFSELNNLEKDNITLEHLLTMTSGLDWDESTYPYTDPRNDAVQLFNQIDPIRFVLNKPMAAEPGTSFQYSSGSTNVLGEIIRKASGLRADSFARDYLFSPLGITDYQWVELPNNVLFASGDLKLKPRDMAKLGDLFLHGGRWKGKQIISESWVSASVQSFIAASQDWDYGYHWWLQTYEVDGGQIESFSASGWGGQKIFVFPGLDMVVVTTAGYYDEPQMEFHIDLFLLQQVLASVK